MAGTKRALLAACSHSKGVMEALAIALSRE
jgi:hypothetical protein